MPARLLKPVIRFLSEKGTFRLYHAAPIRKVIFDGFDRENVALQELTYVFCSDDYLLSINQQFLQHDYFTDIITFPLSGPNEPMVGEIYISIDRVKENAQTFGIEFKEEISRVIFHGALHLCGYRDHSKKEQQLMREKENEWLQQLQIVSRETQRPR